MLVNLTSGRLAIETGSNILESSLTTLTANAWNRIGIARSESQTLMRYFLNGVQTDQKTLFSGSGDNTRPCYLGARDDGTTLGGGGAEGMDGDLAELIVFNHFFTSTETTVLDNYFKTRYGL